MAVGQNAFKIDLVHSGPSASGSNGPTTAALLADAPPSPSITGGISGFVAALRSLKAWCGNPSLQILARRSSVPRSTLADAIDLDRRTLPRLDVVTAFVTACGLAGDQLAPWQRTWKELQQADVAAPAPPAAVETGDRQPAGRNFLPGDIADFTGRTQEIAAVVHALTGANARPVVTISAIDGMAGVGKTALAVHATHMVAPVFPDGQLFLDLHGYTPGREPLEPGTALESLLGQLGIDAARIPRTLEGKSAMWRAETSGRRAVVLLDNAANVDQVRPLLPGGPCPVLITSRRRLVGLEGADILSMKVMSMAEATELFDRVAGAQRVAGQEDAVALAVGLCGFLPLAIRIAAARLRHRPAWTVNDLVARLRDQQRRLSELSSSHQAVAAAFTISFQQLDDRARTMFRLLGLHPGPDVDVPAAASLAGCTLDRAEGALEELLDAHLLDQQTLGRYTFHDLLRAYAASQIKDQEPDAVRSAATSRMIEHYLHSAHNAGALTYATHPSWPRLTLPEPDPSVTPVGFTGREQALAWYAKEHPVVIAVIARAAADGYDSQTWQLAGVLVAYLLQAGLWREWLTVNQTALAAAERAGDERGQAYAHHWLGQLYRSEDDRTRAKEHLHRALDLFTAVGNDALAGETMLDIALTVGEELRFTDAVEFSRRGLAMFRAIGNAIGEGRALNSIGWYLCQMGAYEQALPYCEQALALSRATNSPHVEATTLGSIALIHYCMGNYRQALPYYTQALAARRAKGDYFLQADVMTKLGDTHLALGEAATAKDLWTQALTILDNLQHRDAEGVRTRLRDLEAAAALLRISSASAGMAAAWAGQGSAG
jgi:tetratricopeptide (TPR) repeat protein